MNELEELLNDLDSNAVSKAKDLKNYLEKYHHFDELENMMNSINEFDFDKANEYLSLIRNKI